MSKFKVVKEITSSKDGYGVEALRPPDDRFRQMKAVWDACKKAKTDTPDEVDEFFNYEPPDSLGTAEELKHQILESEWELGFQVAVKDIPAWATHIRFTHRPDC